MSSTDPRICIVGGGPAGVSLALWLHDLDLPFNWFDADGAVGGTLRRVGNPLPNYPGLPRRAGADLIPDLRSHLSEAGLPGPAKARLVAVDRLPSGLAITTAPADTEASVRTMALDAIALCTGTHPRMLGLPGEAELLGRGVEISVTRNRSRYAGQVCIVVGGGDAACEGALLLAELCPAVHLVHRGALRAQRRFVKAVESSRRIETHLADVTAILRSSDRLRGVELSDGGAISGGGLFVRIGVEAALPGRLPAGLVGADGYVLADSDGRTPVAGVYAAGDLVTATGQSVAWAVGSAARVAVAIQQDLGLRA